MRVISINFGEDVSTNEVENILVSNRIEYSVSTGDAQIIEELVFTLRKEVDRLQKYILLLEEENSRLQD